MDNFSDLQLTLEDFCAYSKQLKNMGNVVDANNLPKRLIAMLAEAVRLFHIVPSTYFD